MPKLAVLGIALALAGCASPYSADQVPAARAQFQLALQGCQTGKLNGTLATGLLMSNCIVDADKQFAQQIKLKDMGLEMSLEGQVRIIGNNLDNKLISADEANKELVAAHNAFYAEIDQEQALDAQRRARIAASLAAFGNAMEREADREAYVAAHNQSLNCTSTTFGNQVHTTCN